MNTNDIVKIIIIDDHELFRIGLRSALNNKEAENKIEIIFEASTGRDLFAFLEKGDFPEIILLDMILPDTTGLEIAQKIKSEFNDIKIIVLSSESSEDLLFKLLDIEVDGYISKSDPMFEVTYAIKAVCEDEKYYGKSISKILFDLYNNRRFSQTKNKFLKQFLKNETKDRHDIISEREIEVIKLWCDGLTAKEIGATLDISTRTAETHKNNILKKLGFERFTDLIKYAIKQGIVKI